MNKLIYFVVAIAALTGGLVVFYQSAYQPPEHALYYQHARPIKPFELTDHQGKSFTKVQLADKWSWLFFGYTSCPDICPTTLQELNYIYDDLKTIADSQVLLVSVDPQRDSQEKLARYIAYFNAEFKALRAEHATLLPFARNLGLMYAITEADKTNISAAGVDKDKPAIEDYLVAHSASIVLINPDGNIAAIFKPEQELGQIPSIDGKNLVSDFKKIVVLTY